MTPIQFEDPIPEIEKIIEGSVRSSKRVKTVRLLELAKRTVANATLEDTKVAVSRIRARMRYHGEVSMTPSDKTGALFPGEE